MISIRERKLIDFIENPKGDSLLQSKDEVCVTLSRDFEKIGFLNVMVTPPCGRSWTFLPCVECGRNFLNNLDARPRQKARLAKDVAEYFSASGISEKRVPAGIFNLFQDYGNVNKKLPLGVFWSETIPVNIVDSYLVWLNGSANRILDYSCEIGDRKEEDWLTPLLSEGGARWPISALSRSEKSAGLFMGSKPSISDMKEEFLVLYKYLFDFEKKYHEIGLVKFWARNAFRQSVVTFPYCDDCYGDENVYPLQIIEKRIEVVLKINAPHFYDSINGMPFSAIKNSREQLNYLRVNSKNRVLAKRLSDACIKLDKWIARAEKDYGDFLFFREKKWMKSAADWCSVRSFSPCFDF